MLVIFRQHACARCSGRVKGGRSDNGSGDTVFKTRLYGIPPREFFQGGDDLSPLHGEGISSRKHVIGRYHPEELPHTLHEVPLLPERFTQGMTQCNPLLLYARGLLLERLPKPMLQVQGCLMQPNSFSLQCLTKQVPGISC